MKFTSGVLVFSLMNISWTNIVAVEHLMPVQVQDMLKEKRSAVSGLDRENSSVREDIVGGNTRTDAYRSAKKCPDGLAGCLWPRAKNGMIYIPYVFKSNYNREQQKIMRIAMNEFGFLTCVKFKHRSTESDYIQIVSKSGCTSTIGREGGPQDVSLKNPGCIKFYLIQREMMHTIGFHPEHNRSDRDKYIEVKYENILPGKAHYFDKADTNNLATEYDYYSITHVGMYYQAKSLNPTLVPKKHKNIPIGRSPGISEIDVTKINKLYQCGVCGKLHTSNHGSFSSPNYPALYPNNVQCKWMIRSPSAMKIVLEFAFFYIRPFIGCFRDHLSVYEGSDTGSKVVYRRSCGGLAPATVSSQYKILLTFYTDNSRQAQGFSAKYRFVHCAEMVTTSLRKQTGSINHEGPDHHLDESNCVWLIRAHRGHMIHFEVATFNLKKSKDCANFYLLIRDVSRGPPIVKERICTDKPKSVAVGKALMVEFYHQGAKERPGFKAEYKAILSGKETKNHTDITDFLEQKNCKGWKSKTKAGNIESTQWVKQHLWGEKEPTLTFWVIDPSELEGQTYRILLGKTCTLTALLAPFRIVEFTCDLQLGLFKYSTTDLVVLYLVTHTLPEMFHPFVLDCCHNDTGKGFIQQCHCNALTFAVYVLLIFSWAV